MKIHGKRLPQNRVHIVLPRPEADVVFEVRAVLDYATFDELCPKPRPPMMGRPGQAPFPDYDDHGYNQQVGLWVVKRNDYMIIKSLAFSPGLEWEQVKENDPATWNKYHQEFKDSELTDTEVKRIINACYEVNGLDDAKIEAARQRFLAAQTAQ